METVLKLSVERISEQLSREFDLFICSSSFERRCLSIPRQIESLTIPNVFILSNEKPSYKIEENKRKLLNFFDQRGYGVDVNLSDPLITADNLMEKIKDINSKNIVQNILIDITTFTHETLLILIRVIKTLLPTSNLTFAYTNAAEYSIGDSIKQKWLSRGIKEVRSILGFPGNIIPTRKTHLIVVVGYEHERAKGLIEAIEPNSLSLGYGRSGSETIDKDKGANKHYMHLVEQVAISFKSIRRFEVFCDNPYETCDIIEKQISMAGNKNIIIAPMNNKITTIGTAWSVINNEDVQMCYAQPLKYNTESYSKPGSTCYIFDNIRTP
jgi:hypothetical protein